MKEGQAKALAVGKTCRDGETDRSPSRFFVEADSASVVAMSGVCSRIVAILMRQE